MTNKNDTHSPTYLILGQGRVSFFLYLKRLFMGVRLAESITESERLKRGKQTLIANLHDPAYKYGHIVRVGQIIKRGGEYGVGVFLEITLRRLCQKL